jgi:glycosyltransferase involved in cell wall biosynthesis
MAPVVSIILPTFNRLAFLPPAIDSVFAQTFEDWELLIADDGSAADTHLYLRTVDDPPRVKVLYLPHTGRPGAVRNAALRAARGEYVAFLDSDDLWLRTKLQMQIASLRRNPTRKWSYTKFALVDAAGTAAVSLRWKDRPALAGWVLETLLRGDIVIALQTVLVMRTFLEQLGAFDEELIMCEDDELSFRLAAASEVDVIDEPLTLIRRHQQHSGDDVTAWRDRRRVFEKLLSTHCGGQLGAIVRTQRAAMSAGLAKSQARCGKRLGALNTLVSSAPYSWRYREWWRGALVASARVLAPATLRKFVRRFHHRRNAPHRVG